MESSTKERVINKVREPAKHFLDVSDIFRLAEPLGINCFAKKPSVILEHEILRDHFLNEGRITEEAAMQILMKGNSTFYPFSFQKITPVR